MLVGDSSTGRPMLTLYSFVISHFSEKLRWTLRAAEVPFAERALTPGLHPPIALALGRRGTSVPVVVGDGMRVQGSDAILQRLATRGLIDTLLPDEDDARDEALAAAARHDGLGRAVMLAGYAPMLTQPDEVFRVWTLAASPIEARLLKGLMPVMLPSFRKRFGLSTAGVARARGKIEQVLDDTAARRGERPYLGHAFGIEDLTLCALLAPLAGPEQHPVYAHPRFKAGIAEAIRPWRDHPTLAWVRGVYARDRPEEPDDAPLVRAAARFG
jgi:glutathione S-transferase